RRRRPDRPGPPARPPDLGPRQPGGPVARKAHAEPGGHGRVGLRGCSGARADPQPPGCDARDPGRAGAAAAGAGGPGAARRARAGPGSDRRQPRNARPALAVLTFMNFLNYIDRYVLPSVFEPIKRELHFSDAELGWTLSAFMIAYSITAPLFGRLGDLFTR